MGIDGEDDRVSLGVKRVGQPLFGKHLCVFLETIDEI